MLEDPDDPASLVGLLAEEGRLRVFAAVVLGAGSVDDVVEASGLDRRVVVTALERLAGRGVVTTDERGRLRATAEKFKEVARRVAVEQRASQKDAFDDLPPDAAAVLRNFVRDGQLVRIPAARSKRLIVLDWLAGRFDVGQTYPEGRVNLILGLVHDDVAALRRYLVDEGFLERREGFYWRAGGTVDI